jgi:hypothetical protein
MSDSDGKIRLQKLARVADELARVHAKEAELYAEQARLFEGLSTGEPIVPEPKPRARHLPKFAPVVSEMDRERAKRALEESDNRIRNR